MAKSKKSALALSHELISELKMADVIVIGSAMHNHSITSGLKAYFDQVVRAGLTFHYSSNGPEGLLKDKEAYVITTAGGDYSQEFMQKQDFQTPYLRHILAFIGITDIEFIPAQGLAMDENVAKSNKEHAEERIRKVCQELNTRVAA